MLQGCMRTQREPPAVWIDGDHAHRVTVKTYERQGQGCSSGRPEHLTLPAVKTTQYFVYTRQRTDRRVILDEWIRLAVSAPIAEEIQEDDRIRRWVYIEAVDKYLRVVLLPDGETVHNAFFDRDFQL